jgi:type I restriction enzyme, S subunit
VAKLEKLLGQVDACKQRLEKMPTLLKRFRQSILAAACSGRLTADWREENPDTEPASVLLKRIASQFGKTLITCDINELPFDIPSSWQSIQASDLCRPRTIITYGVLKPVWVKDGVPTVRVQDMKHGKILLDQVAQCCPERAKKFSKTTLETGDLLIAKDGATLGKTAFVTPELDGGNITQHVLRFPISHLVESVFVRLIIDSRHGQDWMRNETRGAALPGVNVGDFRRMPIPLPPLAEQQESVRRVAGLFALADQLEQRLAQARKQVDKLTPSLLARAFAGKLVSQDPNDEPAEKLLERIKRGVQT